MGETIVFEGEHLWIGNLGHAAIVLAMIASLGAAIFYILGNKNKAYIGTARVLLITHVIAVFAIVAALFGIIYGHYFEYQYAWQHSSKGLPWYFMLSCFWEGQEGSFLLWIFWNAVLTLILLKKAKSWEAPVLAIVCLVQVALNSMLLGIEFELFGSVAHIGSSPFELLRIKSPEFLQIPIVQKMGQAKYLHAIQDGSGLNPLLQNYWMVIHPPTLFSGFACTVIPFAYAVASIWNRRSNEWVTAALPYTIITVMILGTGIIMGGYWAYESLSFGGYWAWDPVENASLMPWILMVVTLHMLLISKARGTYKGLSIFLAISSFVMVLYATFLTRSGVLGDSSVHSFVDLGLNGQLLIVLFSFIALPLGLWIYNKVKYKEEKTAQIEEKIHSREFWMFIGALVLVLSLVHIIGATSIPVYNKLFGTNIAPPTDPIAYYNTWQTPFAMIILLIMAVGQFLRFRETPRSVWLKPVVLSLIISVLLTLILAYAFSINTGLYFFFLFACIYAAVANIQYIFTGLKGKLKLAGASIAHAGFGIMLLGVLVSSVNQHVISYNNTGGDYIDATAKDGMEKVKAVSFNRENILLQKNVPVMLDDYRATYYGDTFIAPNKFFKVRYQKIDPISKEINEEFILSPYAQMNDKMGGLVSSPSTKHYLSKDVFTHVNHESSLDKEQPWSNKLVHTVQIGDTITTVDALHRLILKDIRKEGTTDGKQVAIYPQIELTSIEGIKTIQPRLILDMEKIAQRRSIEQYAIREPVEESGLGIKVELTRILLPLPGDAQKEPQYVITTYQRQPTKDYIILKAIVFPWINLVWAGTLIMIFGFFLSIIRRAKEYNKIAK
jgi:cytochrome c-type biogenesis protein CcmF